MHPEEQKEAATPDAYLSAAARDAERPPSPSRFRVTIRLISAGTVENTDPYIAMWRDHTHERNVCEHSRAALVQQLER